MPTFTKEQLPELNQRFRTNLINSLSGVKTAFLVGTADMDGLTNCAVFSSIVHVGANPALLGMISRPNTVARDTIENIQTTGVYTLNIMSTEHYKGVHQTSARYNHDESEFEAIGGINPEYIDGFFAPFVKEAVIKIAMNLAEIHHLNINQTYFTIGEIAAVYIPDELLQEDGNLNYELADILTVAGLETYYSARKIEQLPYAKK